mmetsp:Transcript_53826/g.105275  ORF Transcript_53826/g.105275 Transcript_53826/m.105275 type:complete len:92 (+) Transcript_53826:63-338(+)
MNEACKQARARSIGRKRSEGEEKKFGERGKRGIPSMSAGRHSTIHKQTYKETSKTVSEKDVGMKGGKDKDLDAICRSLHDRSTSKCLSPFD